MPISFDGILLSPCSDQGLEIVQAEGVALSNNNKIRIAVSTSPPLDSHYPIRLSSLR